MKKECEGAEYFSTQPGAVSEEQVPELHSISSIGQSLIYDLLDEEYHVYADRSKATDRELREIAQALFENQGVLHRQRSNATDPIDKIHTINTWI